MNKTVETLFFEDGKKCVPLIEVNKWIIERISIIKSCFISNIQFSTILQLNLGSLLATLKIEIVIKFLGT